MTSEPQSTILTSDGEPFPVSEEGSLGLLALGYQGLRIWRESKGISMPEPPQPGKCPGKINKRKKCILIGWDAADWQIIKPMMEDGEMPAMSRLVEKGVMGNLATLEPSYSPMLWTTISTGMFPDKHGVLGFSEPIPELGGVRPVSGASRKVKAIWNILMQEGYRVHTVGWWPSHPAEPLNGVSISNHFQRSVAPLGEPWPMADRTVHPDDYAWFLSSLRVHPEELTEAHILPFIPNAAEIDQDKDRRLYSLAKIIAEAATIQSAATWILEHEDWDFLGVYFDSIDHFCHGFMQFHPPRLSETDEKDFELYKDVVRSGYRFHDMMLERILELAGPDTTVILVSDHGFHSTDLRPRTLPKEPAAPALQHRPYGILAAKGPGIHEDELVFGATLVDIAPTILHIFGLPSGEDTDGKPLLQMFESQARPSRIPSWETVEGNCGMLSVDLRQDPIVAQEELRQMVALGYLAPPDPDKKKAAKEAEIELKHNLGRVYLGTNRPEKALLIFESLCADSPENTRFQLLAIRSAIASKHLSGCMERIADIREKLKVKILPESELERLAKEESVEGEDAERVNQSLNARRTLLQLELFEGDIHLAENRPSEAVTTYQNVSKNIRLTPAVQLKLGHALRRAAQFDSAVRAYEKVLLMDQDNAAAFLGLAQTKLLQNRYRDAADAALSAVSLFFYFPDAHAALGEALFNMGDNERAAQAFRTCLSIQPDHGSARNRLISLCETRLNLKEEAESLKIYFNEKRSPITPETEKGIFFTQHEGMGGDQLPAPFVIVSGLPRSGTSMMMKMLQAGGMDLFTDGIRKPDENNIHGYFEHEAVKRLPADSSWLKEAENKVIKVLTPLLFHLPDRYPYDVIFMVRDREAVFASQEKMILAQGDVAGDRSVLREAFDRQYSRVGGWARSRANVRLCYILFEEVLKDPLAASLQLQKFLLRPLEIDGMAAQVESPKPHLPRSFS